VQHKIQKEIRACEANIAAINKRMATDKRRYLEGEISQDRASKLYREGLRELDRERAVLARLRRAL